MIGSLSLLSFISYVTVSTAWATPIQKRLGVPRKAEEECDTITGGRNFSTDVNDCRIFYICEHGWPRIQVCPHGTIWTPTLERCVTAEHAFNEECGFVQNSLFSQQTDNRGKSQTLFLPGELKKTFFPLYILHERFCSVRCTQYYSDTIITIKTISSIMSSTGHN